MKKLPPPQSQDRFARLPYSVFDSPSFKGLEHIDVRVLLLLIRRHNGHNNGAIALGVRAIAAECNCSMTTACRALKRLQGAGFVAVTYKGHLVPEIGRPDAATHWKLKFVKEKPNGT